MRCAGAQKEDALEGLGEEVGALGCGRDLLKSDDAGLDLLLDVVVFHVNVLGALGGSVRMGHVDGPLIVDLESGWPWETREGPIMEKAGEPCMSRAACAAATYSASELDCDMVGCLEEDQCTRESP